MRRRGRDESSSRIFAGLYQKKKDHVVTLLLLVQQQQEQQGKEKNIGARIRQHTSAYVSIRQHTSAYVSIATGALDTAPPQRKKEEKKQEEKSNFGRRALPKKTFLIKSLDSNF